MSEQTNPPVRVPIPFLNELNQSLTIYAHGLNYFEIHGFERPAGEEGDLAPAHVRLDFHSGDPSVCISGISNEALLAIVLYRLEGFQQSAFKCRENALAITKIEEALHWLQARTNSRVLKGIEGTQTPG